MNEHLQIQDGTADGPRADRREQQPHHESLRVPRLPNEERSIRRANALGRAGFAATVFVPSRLGTLATHLRGDVETIVARALEKERARRYSSAAELAADIRRHLRNEPIRPGRRRRCPSYASSPDGTRRWWAAWPASWPRWSRG
jgi:hypothetical protein